MELEIEGINVKFPSQPYESQMQMMENVIKGLNNGENCLLESPTGSGKTLALLCSVLAWLSNEKQSSNMEEILNFRDRLNVQDEKQPKNIKKSIPTIYFGTRTHKQIASVIKELRKTAYKDIEMSILASREHTCIHDQVSISTKKDDLCKKARASKNIAIKEEPLVNDKLLSTVVKKDVACSCEHYNNFEKIKFPFNPPTFVDKIWDIEDLVTNCKSEKICPFYLTREFAQRADIVFCPYNYLIDYKIRSKVKIELSNSIIILDEAHNIEDACRNAASSKFTLVDLNDAIIDLDSVKLTVQQEYSDKGIKFDAYLFDYFLKLFDDLRNWLTRSLPQPNKEKIWESKQITEEFKNFYLKEDFLHRIEEFKENFGSLENETKSMINKLEFLVKFVYNEKNHDDFKIIGTRDTKYSLQILCLNPALIFHQFKQCHSVILCSGTLSPLETFESELGFKFHHQLQANHVIPDKQVWVSSVGYGPTNYSLRATFDNRKTAGFKNELGRFIYDTCRTVPFGVLCFFSSYSLLNELHDYWKSSGCLKQIEEKKRVFVEGKTATEFNKLIHDFYTTIDNSNSDDEKNGALLLAVYRGRASEGIDFRDNYARAVLAIGLPLPCFTDKEVQLKRSYNDRWCREKNLLSGTDWYNIQAYRAVNQALGRCIRHKDDWGAIILVDSRYYVCPKVYTKDLSKWIKQRYTSIPGYQKIIESLKKFVDSMKPSSADNLKHTGYDNDNNFDDDLAFDSEFDGDSDTKFRSPLKHIPIKKTQLKRLASQEFSNFTKRKSNDL